jgi:sec-independent protein translocase protein TatB
VSFLGLTFDKLILIALLAALLLGPERLPRYAQKLGELVRSLRRMAEGARGRMRDEMGPEFDEIDWQKLDPRQYDPRRIIRDAWTETEASVMARPTVKPAAPEAARMQQRLDPTRPAPFDSEAT